MSVLTDLIYGGSHAVAGLTEGAVNDAIARYGAEKEIAFPDTAYYFPTIYAATGVKVKKLGDLPACVGVLKSLITDQEDLGQALNAGLATAVGAEILEGLKYVEKKETYEQARVAGIGFVPDPVIRSLGVPLVTGDIPGVAVVLGKAENGSRRRQNRQGLPVQGHHVLPRGRRHRAVRRRRRQDGPRVPRHPPGP
jgi:acetyl-CoA synthase